MAKKRFLISEKKLIQMVMKSIFDAAKGDDSSSQSYDNAIISNNSGSFSDSEYKEKVIKLLGNYEGFRSEAYPDAGKYAIGYGSTYVDGVPVKAGDTITKEKAMRQKSNDIDKFRNVIIGQIGQSAWNDLDMDTKVVLTSIAYNYGSIPDRLLGAVKRGDKQEIHDIIKHNLSGDNAGVNNWRRKDEAMILATGESDRVPNYDV